MLNEIWQLRQSLDKMEIKIDLRHPLIKPLPKSEKNLLRIRLNEDGSVVCVEEIAAEERSGIRRIVQTSDGSFPVLKVNKPFLDLPADSTIWDHLRKTRLESEKIELIDTAFKNGTKRTWNDAGWKWNNSLEKAKLIEMRLNNGNQAQNIVGLSQRLQKALRKEKAFIVQTGVVALAQLGTGHLGALRTMQELLVGKGKDNRGCDKKISVLLVLELNKDVSIYQSHQWRGVAEVLPTNLSATPRGHQHRAEISAFGGAGDLLEEPFPQIKLPVLNSYFPLISMASDADKAKCNQRYGLTEYTVCPVTSLESQRIHGALGWLLKREEGTTWRGVASGKFEVGPRTHKKREKRDLLIVFVDEKPDVDAKTASYFGSGAEITKAKFEVDARIVCEALEAVIREHPKSKLKLFLIRKASDGQAQIALAESPSVKDVLEASTCWQRAVRENIPHITMYLPPITRNDLTLSAVQDARPLAPYPDQVVRLLSHQWVRNGSSPRDASGKLQKANQEIVGPGLADVLALMLRMEGKWEPAARGMLNLLIRRVAPLLIGVFGAQHAYGPRHSQGRHEPFFDYPRTSRETSLRAVAVFGILLDSLGYRKEKYMKDAPYQVGQVMALADTLHKDYCTVVRRGQLPNSLIGTSLMRRALDNPAGALADLSERILEYVRWAKVTQMSREWSSDDQRRIAVNEARKKLRQFQPLAAELSACALPTECNDVMKAQLLLGFLAVPPAGEQNDEGKEEN